MPRMDTAHSLIHSLIHRSLYLQSVTTPSGHSLNGKSLNESPLWHNGYGLLYLPHPRHMVTESRMERLVMDTALKHVHKWVKSTHRGSEIGRSQLSMIAIALGRKPVPAFGTSLSSQAPLALTANFGSGDRILVIGRKRKEWIRSSL